jgi:mRNA interferase MazF
LVAPLTSEVKIEQEDFRPILRPSTDNGVKQISQVMLDCLTVMDGKEITKKIGNLNKKEVLHMNQSLAFVIGL